MKFHINSLGEMQRGNTLLPIGDCNMVEVVGPRMPSKTWWRDYNAHGKDGKPKHPALQKKVDRIVRNFFFRQAKTLLSPVELEAWTFHYRLSVLDDSRFRFYAAGNGTRFRIWTATEFIYFDDDKEARKAIRAAAKEAGCRVEAMSTRPHLDKYGSENPEPKEGYTLAEKDERGLQWFYGPNHGRMETQVAFNVTLQKPETVAEGRRVLRELKKATNGIWRQYGVAVI